MADANQLIFIISQPRSGSTLTQKLLSNNHQVDTVSEPWLLLPYLTVFRSDLVKTKYQSEYAAQGISDYLKKGELELLYKENLKKFLLSLYPLQADKKYFIDKTPRYYEILDEIIEIFPESKFLILKRSPFSVLFSILSTWTAFNTRPKLFENIYRDFMVAPFKIQSFYEKHKHNKNIFEVRYEDLVANPSLYVKKMYDWAELEYSDSVLQIGNNEKVKGIFGDDLYKQKPSMAVEGDKNSNWLERVSKSKNLTLFFKEYSDFLGDDFIENYGYRSPDLNAKSPLFKSSDFKIIEEMLRNETRQI